jgi:uncharacterized lipoprotein YmbA
MGLVACAAAACNPLAPQPDRTQYFVLSPTNAGAAASAGSTARLAIGVGPIKFPGYLKRPGVVTRDGSHRLLISDEKRSGEPLDCNFESVLCQNLSELLGTEKITTYPWYSDIHIDYQVEVRVERFEASQDGRSDMAAIWTIRDGHNGHELASGVSTAHAPVQSGDPAGSAALSQDLAQLSAQISQSIVGLNEKAARLRMSLRAPIPNPAGAGFRSS